MKKHVQNIILGVSVGISGILALLMIISRFYGLQETYIYDEVYSWVTAHPSLSFSTVWNDILRQDVNLPLFNLVLRAWAHIVPFTTTWMRGLPLLFSLITFPVAWWLAPKRWGKLQKFALCCMLICSSALTNYSCILRAYSMGALLTTVFTLLAVRILDAFNDGQPVSPKIWAAFFITGFIGAYTHFFVSGLFFITALFLFICACFYKRDARLIFWSTALAFFLWVPWIWNTYLSMNHFETGWWYETNKMLSSWQILEFNFGQERILLGLLLLLVIGGVSVAFNEKPLLKKLPEIPLTVFQIVVLILVLVAVSKRYNLFMDRYFLVMLPCCFILFTSLWAHLYRRWKITIVLLPLLLFSFSTYYYRNFLPRLHEYSGLIDAFNYVQHGLKADKVLFFLEPFSYPQASVEPLMRFFVPPDNSLEIIPLTQQTAPLMKQEVPLIIPLCGFVRLVNTSVQYDFHIPEKVATFTHSCVVVDPRYKK